MTANYFLTFKYCNFLNDVAGTYMALSNLYMTFKWGFLFVLAKKNRPNPTSLKCHSNILIHVS